MQPTINPNPRPKTKPVSIDQKTGAPKYAVLDAQPQAKDIAK
jgi:hypothetical protein